MLYRHPLDKTLKDIYNLFRKAFKCKGCIDYNYVYLHMYNLGVLTNIYSTSVQKKFI